MRASHAYAHRGVIISEYPKRTSSQVGDRLRSESLPAVLPAIPLDYRYVLDTLADPVLAADASNRVVYANHAVEELLGWPPQSLIGEPLVTIIPPRFRDAHIAAFERYISTGVPRIMGLPIRVPALAQDGGEVDIELTLSAFTRPDGDRLIVASLRDLRERVELERQLVVTRYLRAVTRAAADLTSLLDLDRVLQRVAGSLVDDFDSALARIWLYEPEGNMLHLRASAGLSTAIEESKRAHIDVDTHPYKIAEVARRRTPFIQNGLLGDPQFEQDWVQREQIESVAIFPLVYGGTLVGVVASFSRRTLLDEVIEALATFVAITTTAIHDVQLFRQEQHFRNQAVAAEQRSTFLSEASELLGSSLDQGATLVNVAHLAVANLADWCIVDVVERSGAVRRVATAHPDPRWIDFAEEFERKFPPDTDYPSPVQRVIESGDPLLVAEIAPEQLEESARNDEHLHMLQELAPLSYMCVPLEIHGRALGAITFLTSRPSGRIYGPADLSLAEELAGRAAVALDNARLYRELQEAIRVRDEFLSSVSHDLKNPLATIKARAQILHRRVEKLPEAEQERLIAGLESIDTTAGKMARLINDLVDLVHLRIARPLTLRRESLDLVDLVTQVVADQQSTVDRRILIEREVPHLVGSFDTARLERVLVNLLSNAVKYSPEGGKIILQVSREGTEDNPVGVITVMDEGIGIPAADLPHVFERFYRASNAADIAGTGIGLAGALQIVEQHGGTLAVQSIEGKGSVFTVKLAVSSENEN